MLYLLGRKGFKILNPAGFSVLIITAKQIIR